MADTNDSFRREVEEELRREQYAEIWKRYGTYIVAGAIAILAGVSGFQYWKASQRAAAEKGGAAYGSAVRLVQSGKTDEALKAFEDVAKTETAGYSALAKLQLAGSQKKDGKTAEAVKLYDELANGTDVDPLFRDFATLQSVAMQVGTISYDEVKNRLNRLSKSTNPFRFSASELQGLAAFQAGNFSEAREVLSALLADPKAPGGMSTRLQLMLSRIAEREMSAEAAGAATNKTSEDPASSSDTTKDGSGGTKTPEAAAKTDGSKTDGAKQ